jgi:hypothetical protein
MIPSQSVTRRGFKMHQTEFLAETRKTLAEAAAMVGVNVGTVHRWRLKGVRGVKLSCFLIAGRRYTSQERLEDFIAKSTAAVDGPPQDSNIRTPSQRKRAADRADKELEAAGV